MIESGMEIGLKSEQRRISTRAAVSEMAELYKLERV